jgi:hypothetical protein
MTITDWRAFYATLVIRSGYGQPVRKPTQAQLDRFEAETGFRLPRSYREYILVFGPGEFPAVLKVAAPGYEYLGNTFDLLTASRSYGYTREEAAAGGLPADEQERIGRLFYFGLHHGRQWLGWDPQDVRDAEAPEYAVYRVDWLSDGPEFMAASFRQLVEDTCEALFAPDPEYDEESMGPQRGFQPACWVPVSGDPT